MSFCVVEGTEPHRAMPFWLEDDPPRAILERVDEGEEGTAPTGRAFPESG